ncbi:MAG TPA: MmcQ/YjbR family DNA-binding protein [Actinomycetota bacterium]|nr:MmcQ/YjbR family DNA-binding protein [Actinomycetota bacterium]
MVNLAAVRRLALALPEAEETTSYGTPAFKVRGKLFARLREEGDILVVKCDLNEREALIQSEPETYFVTPHYQNYPYVLVRMNEIDLGALREVLTDAWRIAAPKRLVFNFDLQD